MSRSWIPGFVVAEGPEKTGITLRFRGFRQKDGVPVWIRLDGFPPNELRSALAVARVYQETARLDHPDLPPVLGYGSTDVAGRPFIAFQLAPELLDRRQAGSGALDEAVETLAEIQLAAHEIGAAGVHVPYFELERIREGVQLDGRRLPIREYLVEPRRADGLSALTGAVEPGEWQPFTAPEARSALRRPRRPSVRQALSFRLAAQVHFLVTGTVAAADRPAAAFRPAPQGAAGAAVNPLGGLLSDTRRLATGAALGHNANRRPPVETFLS